MSSVLEFIHFLGNGMFASKVLAPSTADIFAPDTTFATLLPIVSSDLGIALYHRTRHSY